MGICIGAWRARIGSYRSGYQTLQDLPPHGFYDRNGSSFIISMLLILMVLIVYYGVVRSTLLIFNNNLCSQIDVVNMMCLPLKNYILWRMWRECFKNKAMDVQVILLVALEILGGVEWVGLLLYKHTWAFTMVFHFLCVSAASYSTFVGNYLLQSIVWEWLEKYFWEASLTTHGMKTSQSSTLELLTNGPKDMLFMGTMKLNFLTLLVLLVIGNVEQNPGPTTFKCLWCSLEFSSMTKHASHQKIHSAQPNFMFTCSGPTCTWLRFKSYQGLSTHILLNHSQHIVEPVAEPERNCVIPLCTEAVKCGSYALCTHLFEHLSKGETFVCPFKDHCDSVTSFKTENHFRSHLSVKHQGWRNNELDCSFLIPSVLRDLEMNESTGDIGGNDCDDSMDDGDLDVNKSAEPEFDAPMFAKHVGQFYLMLLSECILSEDTVQKISIELKTLSELNQHWYRENITKALSEEGMDESNITSIVNVVTTKDVFYATHHKEMPGPSLTSTSLREKFYVTQFGYQEPDEVPLDVDREDGEVVHHIPLKKTLTKLFQDPSVNRQIEESFKRNASMCGEYRDYYDGEICKKSGLPQERIDIIVFQDGFKSGRNPIGSAAKKLGFVGTYFVIGNLKPYIRSKVKSINLSLLIKESLLKNRTEYGPKKCFKPLIDDFKELSRTGITFNGRIVPVCLQYISGDNLGAHTIGGFVESFSSKFFCRFCEITKEEFHADHLLLHNLRSIEAYEEALQELAELKLRNPNSKIRRGVKEASPFNDIPNFHVADPRLPVCLAHDLFENGVVSCDFKIMISYFVEQKWFSFDVLEGLINRFKYSTQDIKNKPAPVPKPEGKKKKLKLGGHAVQNWCLLRLFPFIIEGRIKNPNDKVWRLYLKLKSLIEIICKPAFKSSDLEELELHIKDYMTERKRDLPGVFVKPKYHFLVHYVEMIRLFGPLLYVWTLRFEAKHQFFKRIVSACNNYVNVGLTMARRHQKWFSYMTSGLIYPSGVGDSPRTKPFKIEDQLPPIKEAVQSHFLTSQAVETECVIYDDIVLKKESCCSSQRSRQ